jgi:hypothetical protein
MFNAKTTSPGEYPTYIPGPWPAYGTLTQPATTCMHSRDVVKEGNCGTLASSIQVHLVTQHLA